MRDVFLAQDLAEFQIVVEADVPVAGSQDDLHVPQLGVIGIGHEVDRVVEVDIVVIIPVHKGFNIEGSTQTKEVANHFRMPERKIAGAKSTKADATAGNFPRAGVIPDLWYKLFRKKLIVLDVPEDSELGMNVPIPTRIIDAVRAKNLDKTSLYKPFDGVQHATIFSLEVAAKRGREDDKRVAMSAEGEDLYVVAKMMAIEFGECFLHGVVLINGR